MVTGEATRVGMEEAGTGAADTEAADTGAVTVDSQATVAVLVDSQATGVVLVDSQATGAVSEAVTPAMADKAATTVTRVVMEVKEHRLMTFKILS